MESPFDALEGHRYIALTTYRRSGEGITTPVWFARVGDKLHVVTDIESGKAKRIRNNPEVALAPSDFQGRSRGGSVDAVARIMDESESEIADRALREKYGWQYRTFGLVIRLLGKSANHAFLEISPVAQEG